MAKKLMKAQLGKIVKTVAAKATKAAKPAINLTGNDIKKAVTISEREALRNRFKELAKKKTGGFPDLTGDGKVTKADILKGRGVIKKSGGATKAKKK